ncbi:hypothetical protein COCNU_scaffold008697G000010 [Cocos nucifera]|nr:hypothetical protein [Cocos nucifera]
MKDEKTRKTTTGTNGGDHRNLLGEDLEAKNGLQDQLELPYKKRETYQEPRSVKPNLVEEETRKTTTATSDGDHHNLLGEDLESKNGLRDPDLPYKKGKTYHEPRCVKPTLVEEENRKVTTGTKGEDNEKLCTGVQPCKELTQALLGLGINRTVRVLRKKLTETDVSPNQNRLQHSEKEVQEVLLDMMTEEEKQLATQAGTGDGLRVSVLDQLGRVYHMKLKKLHNSKKYFRFRGSDYHMFVKDNGLKAGEILETWAARVQRRGGGQIREEGDGRIMDGELLLVMLKFEDNSYETNDNKETEMSTPAEKEALDALLLLQKKPVIFGSPFLH